MMPPSLLPPWRPADPSPAGTPPLLTPALSPEKTLRKLFLTLFLRGHSARGLKKGGAPKSVGDKLSLTLLFYFLFGAFALFFIRQPVFALSLYMHGMTFVFLGMFVAASAGEVLFNQQEGDILLHRPVEPRTLLWAKVWVLVQVSLWLAGAFNLVALFAGVAATGGGWLYPFVHALSTVLEALFCTGTVVLVYQLCLRWFGRERLDGLMTTAQVLLAVTAVAGGQIVPRLIGRFGVLTNLTSDSWWLALLPPAWFAGIDDALAGRHSESSWMLAVLGAGITAAVLWFAFGRLAEDYVTGLQSIGESTARRPARPAGRRRWLETLVATPPMSWWLRDSVSRASFLLTLAYLTRDRDMKLRVYPGLAPVLIMPFIMLMQGHDRHGSGAFGNFGVAFSGAYLGLLPMLALGMLQFSQHWQASDLFRAAPLAGPSRLYQGARRAVLLFMALPLAAVFGLVAWLLGTNLASMALFLPGLIVLPLYTLIPGLGGRATPLSQPTESAKSAGRGLSMILVMFISMALAAAATFAFSAGWFAWFILVETVITIGVYAALSVNLRASRWPSME